MKHKLQAMIFITITSLLALLLFVAASLAYARMAGYSLPWWTADSGGGDSSGGNYSLSGTIGQPDAGTLSGGNYRLEGGFWGVAPGGTPQPPVQHVYLPVVRK